MTIPVQCRRELAIGEGEAVAIIRRQHGLELVPIEFAAPDRLWSIHPAAQRSIEDGASDLEQGLSVIVKGPRSTKQGLEALQSLVDADTGTNTDTGTGTATATTGTDADAE